MCLLLFAVNEHPEYPLVVAANRDEFYVRPTELARYWDDAPEILGGRDLERGGTWLGVAKNGRWAAVTSFREPDGGSYETSRGHLVSEYLKRGYNPSAYAEKMLAEGHRYAGFNLLVGNAGQIVYCSNRDAKSREIRKGMHGLSNHLLDTPWPKLMQSRDRFAQAVNGRGGIDAKALFEVLNSREVPADEQLPDTGVGLEWERLLASAFIASPGYGTRSSTLILMDAAGRVSFTERSYQAGADGLNRPGLFRDAVFEFQVTRPLSG